MGTDMNSDTLRNVANDAAKQAARDVRHSMQVRARRLAVKREAMAQAVAEFDTMPGAERFRALQVATLAYQREFFIDEK